MAGIVPDLPVAPPRADLRTGDCRDILKTLPDASVDAVVTDPPYDLTANKKGGTGHTTLNLNHPGGRSRIGSGGGNVLAALRLSTGQWRAGCSCGAEPVADIVLDLFGGSGTTAQVALAHGRHAVLIDANPTYGDLQSARIARSVAPRPSRRQSSHVAAPSGQMCMPFEIEVVE
ncbi:hypothetical protein THIX_60080 [Thiomonas sp. X19]|uniref:DNA methyltransferase n=1 Tax=Thiomonas sp. X19 TaxID=1050370 RepID=UPI000B7368EB|nr:DNA methyltransferase [Thiomonas sp. X19]SCC94022.1 hypothetical protein THIX_60080 [Thiomonas sp. X19]